MDSTIRDRMLAGTAAVGWAVAGVNATPWVNLDLRAGILACSVAVCSSLSYAFRCRTRPIQAVYDLGFDAGRRAGITEARTVNPSVVQFRQRRGA